MNWLAELNDTIEMESWFEIQSSDAKELRDFILEKDAEIERLRETVSMLAGDRDLYMEEIKQKNAEIERLRAALKFYADRNHKSDDGDCIENGQIARSALLTKGQ